MWTKRVGWNEGVEAGGGGSKEEEKEAIQSSVGQPDDTPSQL